MDKYDVIFIAVVISIVQTFLVHSRLRIIEKAQGLNIDFFKVMNFEIEKLKKESEQSDG